MLRVIIVNDGAKSHGPVQMVNSRVMEVLVGEEGMKARIEHIMNFGYSGRWEIFEGEAGTIVTFTVKGAVNFDRIIGQLFMFAGSLPAAA